MAGFAENVRCLTYHQDNAKSKPNEDACDYMITSHGDFIFAVADGVSRSVYGDPDRPWSALPAAEKFCRLVCSSISLLGYSLQEAFAYANLWIADINEKKGIIPDTVDYLGLDYLCCEAVAGKIERGIPRRFSYGYIGDCGVLVYDKNLLPVFLSDNQVGILEQFRDGFTFNNKSDQRFFWRRQLRNHPGERYMTYGALTGEKAALAYVKTGSIDLEADDTAILFSDGIYPFLFDHQFRYIVTSLLQNHSGEKIIQRTMTSYINRACKKLQEEHVGNLDDDKTFIAFAVVN